MFGQRKSITALLVIILVLQSPLLLAFNCADHAMDISAAVHDMTMDKCHEMQKSNVENQGSCDSGCCLATSSPTLINNAVVSQAVHAASPENLQAVRLVNTYLKSENRPPIS